MDQQNVAKRQRLVQRGADISVEMIPDRRTRRSQLLSAFAKLRKVSRAAVETEIEKEIVNPENDILWADGADADGKRAYLLDLAYLGWKRAPRADRAG